MCERSGRIICKNCEGFGQLKCFIELKVTFDVKEDDSIVKSEEVPDEELRKCHAFSSLHEEKIKVNIN
jgi:hypothetical protein